MTEAEARRHEVESSRNWRSHQGERHHAFRPRQICKTVNSGGSFGSSTLRQEIGLGNATAIAGVEISWPASGIEQRLTGFSLDRAYRITEGVTGPVAMDLKRFTFDLRANSSRQHVLHSGRCGR